MCASGARLMAPQSRKAYPPREDNRRRLRIPLTNTSQIRTEMGRVYREMRAGIIKTDEGSRLVAALSILRQTREFELIEGDLLQMREELNRLQTRNDKPLLGVVK